MHEFSIISALLDLVEDDVRKHNAKSVTKITVKIGALSGVVIELFDEAFHTCKRGSIAENADLKILRQEIEIQCLCGYSGGIVKRKFICPECGGKDIRVTDGEEIILQRLELEMPD